MISNEAFEYAVLEFHFAFWQFHNKDCSTIPDNNATYQELADYFFEVLWMNTFSDYYMEFYEPYVYQALTETGYPAYATEHISDLLLYAINPGAEFFLTRKYLNYIQSLTHRRYYKLAEI